MFKAYEAKVDRIADVVEAIANKDLVIKTYLDTWGIMVMVEAQTKEAEDVLDELFSVRSELFQCVFVGNKED